MSEHERVVAFSGGKDSTAMLLRLLELGERIDRIVFADTGFEFPELYEYIKRIEKHIGRKVEIVKPETTFEEWFSGKVTRGELEGEVRGFPGRLHPCYWTREAKIKPLEKLQKDAEIVYVGIAYDEKERMSSDPKSKIRYPLVEWKWTEQDCVNYLNKLGLLNPLYVNFNRLGCWFCPKQGINSLYVLWKLYPDLWSRLKDWERRQEETRGHGIFARPLCEIEADFEAGKKPKKLPKYDCWDGCEGVKRAYKATQTGLYVFNCGERWLGQDEARR